MAQTGQPPSPRGAAIVLVAVVIAAHLLSLGGGFVWDDDDYVTENPVLETAGGLGRIWLELGATPQYYPLVHTSFWIERRLWGERPLGYHAVNVLLHAVNALMVWKLLRRLGVRGAWLAAALFGVHPVHAESVAWITERKNVLSAVFYLGALWVWIEDRRRAYLLSLALFVGALLSKTVTATLPAIFLLLTWWRTGTIGKRDAARSLPFFALGAAAGWLTSWMERFYVGASGGDWALSFAERFEVAGRAAWFYVGKLVWPHPLMFIYPRWNVAAWGHAGWFPLAGVVALVAALWALRGRIGRGPLAAALFFGITLGPALGFVNVYPMRFSYVADHFQYLASLGPIALAAAWAAREGNRSRVRHGILAAGVAVVLVALAASTWSVERDYADEETLWRRTLRKDPDIFIAQNNVGGILLQRGEADAAEGYFRRAIELEPTYPEGYDNLGIVLHDRGRYDDAAASYREALARDPRYANAHNNLGITLAAQRQLDAAIASFREAIRLRPGFTRARVNLGVALYRAGDAAGALEVLKEAVRRAPGDGDAREALSVVERVAG